MSSTRLWVAPQFGRKDGESVCVWSNELKWREMTVKRLTFPLNLVIETGPDRRSFTEIPLLYSLLNV